MATKVTDKLNPEWEMLLSRVNGRERAMSLDSLATTHPILQKIHTVDEVNQAFDDITYEKGEAVITMLEGFAGEDARSEEHTSELQSLMRISYAVFCLKKKTEKLKQKIL